MNKPYISIQNTLQLNILCDIISNNNPISERIIFNDICIDIDIKEILTENSLTIPKEQFKKNRNWNENNQKEICIDFIDVKEKTNLYTYYPIDKVMYETKENDIAINLSDIQDKNYQLLTGEKKEFAERTFLALAGFDLSNGFWKEDVDSYARKYEELYLAVFGYSFKS